MGIMIFPVIVLTARDALLAVNEQYRLAGAALGVSRWYMLHRVIIPQAAPAILSGILLAMGYAAGATAPIMVTAAVISAGMSGGLMEPVMALPYHLYILFSQHISMEKAYGTALLLVLLLLFLNITALLLRGGREKEVTDMSIRLRTGVCFSKNTLSCIILTWSSMDRDFAVIGPSGCGKTTLLKVLTGRLSWIVVLIAAVRFCSMVRTFIKKRCSLNPPQSWHGIPNSCGPAHERAGKCSFWAAVFW